MTATRIPAPVVGGAWLLMPMLAWAAWAALLRPNEQAPTKKQLLVAEALGKGDEVVVVGNSTVGTDIDARVVEEATGAAEPPAILRLDGSMAPGWLAALDGGVFSAGHQPRLVLVVGALEWLVTTGFESVSQRADAQAFAAEGSESASVLFGGASGVVGRARGRAAALHATLREGVRDYSVGAVFGGEGADLAERGRATALSAAATVFGAMHPKEAGAGRVLPVVEGEEASSGVGFGLETAAALVRLAHDHHAQMVFVRLPDRPGDPATGPVRALEDDLVALLNQLGAGWIDLGGLALGQDGFRDGLHMNNVGRTALNGELGPLLEAMDPLHRDRLPPALPRVTAGAAQRTGTPPRLAAAITPGASPCRFSVAPTGLDFLFEWALRDRGLGRASPLRVRQGERLLELRADSRAALDAGCTGTWFPNRKAIEVSTRQAASVADLSLDLDASLPLGQGRSDEAWWVYPGTQLDVAVSHATGGALSVALRVLGSGEPIVSAGGRPVSLTAAGEDRDGTVGLEGLPEDWNLTVGSPASGPWVDLESAVVERAGERRVLLGEIVPAVRLASRNWVFAKDPPPIPAGEWGAAEPDRWTRALPDLAVVGSEGPRSSGLETCTPVRVEVEGKLVAQHGKGLGRAGQGAVGSMFREGLLTLDLPRAPDAAVVATLDPGRRCNGGMWLYPGDSVEARDRDAGVGSLRHGAGSLRLSVATLGGFGGFDRLLVDVSNRAGSFLHRELGPEDLVRTGQASSASGDRPGMTLDLPLDRLLADGAGPLTTRFENRSKAWLIVERAELIDAGPTR